VFDSLKLYLRLRLEYGNKVNCLRRFKGEEEEETKRSAGKI